jgi:hypothetical protein
MIREQKPGVTTWRCPRERTCGRFEMRSESEPSREARDDEREALKAILWEWLGPIEADGDEMGAFADAILAAGYRKHPEPEITDAELIDLWWTNCADEWAVPEWVMVTFGRAVIASALRVPVKEGEQ